MTRTRKRVRIVVMRGRRLYVVCGALRTAEKRGGFVWLPCAAALFVLAVSAFALVHPIEPPDSIQHRLPLAQVAHYTAADFFSAAH